VSREGLLRLLSNIESVYVPSLYEAAPNSMGHLVPRPKEGPRGPVRPARVRNLRRELTEPARLVPLTDVTHSRLSVEVMRGCPRTCRFCMPGAIYDPVRRKSREDVLVELKNGMAVGGWEEVSLLSLSTSDYPGVTALVQEVSKAFLGQGVNVSLPSMRPGTLPPQLAKTLTYVRKSGLTFAPEAGSESLRRVINKDISDDEMIDSVKVAATAGWNSVKLYFMIGLPTEKEEDVEAIAQLVARLRQAARVGARRMGIKVSVAGFVPKPHTPFQWEAQLGLEEISRRIALLNRLMRSRNTIMRWRDPETTFLEGLLSRGDRKMAEAIYSAWSKGCRFDGWSDQFEFHKWKAALEETRIDTASYLAAREISEPQPWSHIRAHASWDFLARERERAYAGLASGGRGTSLGSGAAGGPAAGDNGGADSGAVTAGAEEGRGGTEQAVGFGAAAAGMDENGPWLNSGGGEAPPRALEPEQEPDRAAPVFGRGRRKSKVGFKRASRCFRVRYAKLGSVRFISHLDVIRAFDRALRKAQLPVAFTQGFSKHAKMSFGPPLAVGMTSTAEYLDIEFSVPQSVGFAGPLDGCLPEGLSVLAAEAHGEAKPDSLMKSISSATYAVTFSPYLLYEIEKNGSAGTLAEALGRAGARLRGLVRGERDERDGAALEALRPVVLEGEVNEKGEGPFLVFRVRLNVKDSPKAREIAKELMSPISFDSRLLGMERTGVWIERDGALLNPLEILTAGPWIQSARRGADPGVNYNL
jgi:radical SAM-linked protein